MPQKALVKQCQQAVMVLSLATGEESDPSLLLLKCATELALKIPSLHAAQAVLKMLNWLC